MPLLLDRFAPPAIGFVPRTAQDLFALRLAHKLNDPRAAAHYAMLAARYSEARLVTAYRRALRHNAASDLGMRFLAELEHASDYGSSGPNSNLLAVRVERRSIAAAVFYGDHLEYTQMRQLSSIREKALGSAVTFVNWLLDRFSVDTGALEALSVGSEIQRQALTDAITKALRDRMLPIWQVPKTQLFEACGFPALKSRKQLREVIATIWPVLAGTNGKAFIRDAAGLGLYVQTERRFIIN
jgi:hypothetical protein